jgi:amidase
VLHLAPHKDTSRSEKSADDQGGPVIARLLFLALLAGSALAQNVVHYTTTIDNVKYVFATAEPVARLKSGDILDTNTLDCFGNALRKPGDTVTMIKRYNPLAGPFLIEGAEPGDTLAVKILDLQVDGDSGVGGYSPGFGAITGSRYSPALEPPLKERVWFYQIDHASNTATYKALDSDFSVKIPLHPFFGCIGVAPADGEARSSTVPAEFGGNMDAAEASVGNTVYFPVNVKGGLFYIGDGHAAQGDGEIAGSGLEVPLKARVQFNVIKGRTISWPQFENDQAIMTIGAYRPVDDAVRIAFTELVHWIHRDYGLSDLDAYELLSKVAKVHFSEMVDPNYVVVASIEKKYLPPAKKP